MGESSHKVPMDSSHIPEAIADEKFAELVVLAAPARQFRRLSPSMIRQIILRLCEGRYMTAADLASLMHRNAASLRDRFLTPMVEEGLLTRKYLTELHRPDQAYRTTAKAK